MHLILKLQRACDNDKCSNICVVAIKMLTNFWFCAGEFHGRRDPGDDGQEEEYQEHVCHCPRRSWQVDANRFSGVEGRYYRKRACRRDSLHGHPQGRTRQMYHYQVYVSTLENTAW